MAKENRPVSGLIPGTKKTWSFGILIINVFKFYKKSQNSRYVSSHEFFVKKWKKISEKV